MTVGLGCTGRGPTVCGGRVANVEHSRAVVGGDEQGWPASPRGSAGVSRRTALVLLAAGITPVFLASCGAPAPSAPPSTATLVPAAKPTVAPPVATAVPIPPTPAAKSGGTIRTGQVGDI